MQLQEKPKKVIQGAEEWQKSLRESLLALWGERMSLTPGFGLLAATITAKPEYYSPLLILALVYFIFWLLHVSSTSQNRAKRQDKQDKLVLYLVSGDRLLQQIKRDEEIPFGIAKKWSNHVDKFVSETLGRDYAARFKVRSDTPQQRPMLEPKERRLLYQNIDRRVRRLKEFVEERAWEHS